MKSYFLTWYSHQSTPSICCRSARLCQILKPVVGHQSRKVSSHPTQSRGGVWSNQHGTFANPKTGNPTGLMQNQMQATKIKNTNRNPAFVRLIVLDAGLLKCKQQKSMLGRRKGVMRHTIFYSVTPQRDVICQKFLLADCDVCQIIQPASLRVLPSHFRRDSLENKDTGFEHTQPVWRDSSPDWAADSVSLTSMSNSVNFGLFSFLFFNKKKKVDPK